LRIKEKYPEILLNFPKFTGYSFYLGSDYMGRQHKFLIPVLLFGTIIIQLDAQVKKQDFCSGITGYYSGNRNKSADLRMLKYDVKCYHLALELSNQNAHIKGEAKITCQVLDADLTDFVIELATNLQIDSVCLGSETLPFMHDNDMVIITLNEVPQFSSLLTIQVFYHGQDLSEGLYNGIDRVFGNMVTWTLSEPLSSKYWYPVKQVLEDKADSVIVSVITEPGLRVGSNGLLTGVDTLENGKVQHHWVSHYPIAYYLISVAVSDYQEYSMYAQPSGRNDSLLIQNYVYNHPDYLGMNMALIDKTIDLINLYSDLFTLYPFYDEKYGHCLTPAGPYMEHQTMSSMRDFNYRIVAHELAHQWFGDQVTCGTWQDIWINEGFASYAEYLGFEQLGMFEEARAWLADAHDHALNEPEGSVYIPLQELWNPGRLFNYRLTYRKGAAIIHMIRFELDNDSLFFNILRHFQTTYKNDVATGLDFKSVLETESSMDFSSFFDQWYFGKGFPSYDITWGQDYDTLWIRSVQTPSSVETPLFLMPLEIKLNLETRDTLVRVHQTALAEEYRFKVDERVLNIVLDPNQWSLLQLRSINRFENPDQMIRSKFIIYPNPANDYVRLDFLGNLDDKIIQLVDMTGQLVSEYSGVGNFTELNIGHLSAGIYFVKIILGDDVWTQKFVKQ